MAGVARYFVGKKFKGQNTNTELKMKNKTFKKFFKQNGKLCINLYYNYNTWQIKFTYEP